MENKIIKIYSHPRSGTNYLGALLKENFYPTTNLGIAGQWGHWNHRATFKTPVKHGKLFGSHSFNLGDNQHPKIYIYRDGRPVCLSVWKSKNFNNINIKNISFSEYLKYKLDWEGTPGIKCIPKNNIIQHWERHVNTWMRYVENSDNIMVIKYEELVSQTEKTLNSIAEFYSLNYIDGFKNINSLVGPSPNSGKVDEWKKHYSKEDEEFFFKIIKNNKYLYK